MNILFIGDIVGSPGRLMLQNYITKLKQIYKPTITIVNGENAAGGKGITEKIAKQFYEQGVQVITLGNHTWDQKGIENFLDQNARIIRPANFPPGTPGNGFTVIQINEQKVGIINLQGRTYLPPIDCPFRKADEIISQLQKQTSIILVDFHAEATSEKEAMGWYLDGRVSAVVGTHTHVQTADEKILPKGTAYITDVGMTGPSYGILGMSKEAVLYRFTTAMPSRFEVTKEGPTQLNAVLIAVESKTGLAKRIERIRIDDTHPFHE